MRTVHDVEAAARAGLDSLNVSGSDVTIAAPMYPTQPNRLLAALLIECQRRGIAATVLVADLGGQLAFIPAAMDANPGLRILSVAGLVPKFALPIADFIPSSLFDFTQTLDTGELTVDIAAARIAPEASRDDLFAIGPSVAYLPNVMKARVVVAELAADILHYPGFAGLPGELIDVAVPVDDSLGTVQDTVPGSVEAAIGAAIAEIVPDGASLQIGVGKAPTAVAEQLQRKGRKQLTIHSGMLTGAMFELQAACGAPHGSHRVTALLGTADFYASVARDRKIHVVPVSETHSLDRQSSHPRFFAVNSAFEVDLCGQVNAEYVGGRQRAAASGQIDFAKRAHASPDGANIVCLSSLTASGASRIVAHLQIPSAVSRPRPEADYVVTEFGAADLHDRTPGQRAESLIAIAHPSHRERLLAEWRASV